MLYEIYRYRPGNTRKQVGLGPSESQGGAEEEETRVMKSGNWVTLSGLEESLTGTNGLAFQIFLLK